MSENRTLDITPTPRATALVCIAILLRQQENDTCNRDAIWAEEQILKMIIEDWPEGEEG